MLTKDVKERYDHYVDVHKRFVDALERENQFDMNSAFDEMAYAYVKLLADISENGYLVEELNNAADQIAIDDAMMKARSHRLNGLDLRKLKKKIWAKGADNGNN